MTSLPNPEDLRLWFVAQLKPNGLGRALEHLHRQGFPTFSPSLKSLHVKSGSQVATRKPLFPGYFFVNFDPTTNGWSAINSTRGVARLVVVDPRNPVPLPQRLMAGLLARCDQNGQLLPHRDLDVGDRIRILSGPFAEFVTQIHELKDRDRVGLLIELMGRQVRADFRVSDVVRIDEK